MRLEASGTSSIGLQAPACTLHSAPPPSGQELSPGMRPAVERGSALVELQSVVIHGAPSRLASVPDAVLMQVTQLLALRDTTQLLQASPRFRTLLAADPALAAALSSLADGHAQVLRYGALLETEQTRLAALVEEGVTARMAASASAPLSDCAFSALRAAGILSCVGVFGSGIAVANIATEWLGGRQYDRDPAVQAQYDQLFEDRLRAHQARYDLSLNFLAGFAGSLGLSIAACCVALCADDRADARREASATAAWRGARRQEQLVSEVRSMGERAQREVADMVFHLAASGQAAANQPDGAGAIASALQLGQPAEAVRGVREVLAIPDAWMSREAKVQALEGWKRGGPWDARNAASLKARNAFLREVFTSELLTTDEKYRIGFADIDVLALWTADSIADRSLAYFLVSAVQAAAVPEPLMMRVWEEHRTAWQAMARLKAGN